MKYDDDGMKLAKGLDGVVEIRMMDGRGLTVDGEMIVGLGTRGDEQLEKS